VFVRKGRILFWIAPRPHTGSYCSSLRIRASRNPDNVVANLEPSARVRLLTEKAHDIIRLPSCSTVAKTAFRSVSSSLGPQESWIFLKATDDARCDLIDCPWSRTRADWNPTTCVRLAASRDDIIRAVLRDKADDRVGQVAMRID